MSEETSEKRGRGRPKGSLNKKTLAKQEELRQVTTLDVSFDQEKDLEQEQEPEPEPEPDVPEVKKPRPPRKPKIPERVPEPETEAPEEEPEEPEPVKPKPKRKPRKTQLPGVVTSAEAIQHLYESEEEAPVVKKPRARAQPRADARSLATTAPRDPEPPLTYLQVLQKGLAAAKATQKAEKVQRYDAYFSHL